MICGCVNSQFEKNISFSNLIPISIAYLGTCGGPGERPTMLNTRAVGLKKSICSQEHEEMGLRAPCYDSPSFQGKFQPPGHQFQCGGNCLLGKSDQFSGNQTSQNNYYMVSGSPLGFSHPTFFWHGLHIVSRSSLG